MSTAAPAQAAEPTAPHRPTLAGRTARALAVMTVAFGGSALATAAAVHHLGLDDQLVVESGTSRPAHDPVSERAAALSKKYDCWNGAAPADMAGKIPGHVIVTVRTPEGRRTRHSATHVSAALDHVFRAPVPGMVVHAFCR